MPFREKQYVDEDVWEMALDRVRFTYDFFDHVAVMFSGGKDSTATLEVTLAVAEERGELPLRVIFFDEEAIPYQTEDYMRRRFQDPRIAGEWLCLPVKHRNACSFDSPFWYPWAPEDEELWVRPLPPEAITEWPGYPTDPKLRLSIPDTNGLLFPPKLGRCAMLMGIRAAESVVRHRAVAKDVDKRIRSYVLGETGDTTLGNLSKVYPVYDWVTADVWTAPAKFGWDYNEAYDAMEMAGVSHHDQRCAPPYGEQPIRGLWTFKQCFPEVWDRMAYRVPGAATAARYGNTEIYGLNNEHLEPSEGQTWEDFIVEQCLKHNDLERAYVANRVRGIVRNHYKRTAEPIVVHTAHPDSGVSWRKVLNIAVRGDFKARTNMVPVVGGIEKWEAAKAKYDDERRRLEAGGAW